MPALITFRKCSRKNISFRPRNTAPANKPRKNRRNSTPYRKIQTDRRINVCRTRIKYKLPHKVCRLRGKTMRKIKSITTKKGRTHPFFLFYFFCCVPAFKTGGLFAYESAKLLVHRLIARFPGVNLHFCHCPIYCQHPICRCLICRPCPTSAEAGSRRSFADGTPFPGRAKRRFSR